MNSHDMTPKKGSLALCSLNSLGLITSDAPQEIVYPDGKKGTAWVGIHLTDAVAPIGSAWCSRSPFVVGEIVVGPSGICKIVGYLATSPPRKSS
jgi:hypothetical protein